MAHNENAAAAAAADNQQGTSLLSMVSLGWSLSIIMVQ
jgi:hypothetical protein